MTANLNSVKTHSRSSHPATFPLCDGLLAQHGPALASTEQRPLLTTAPSPVALPEFAYGGRKGNLSSAAQRDWRIEVLGGDAPIGLHRSTSH